MAPGMVELLGLDQTVAVKPGDAQTERPMPLDEAAPSLKLLDRQLVASARVVKRQDPGPDRLHDGSFATYHPASGIAGRQLDFVRVGSGRDRRPSSIEGKLHDRDGLVRHGATFKLAALNNCLNQRAGSKDLTESLVPREETEAAERPF
jgi:hypothetical protein